MTIFVRYTAVLALASGALLSPALAQTQPPPQRTTASYDSWEMRCENRTEGTTTVQSCEVAQSIQVQGQPGPIAQIAVGRAAANAPMKIAFQVPIAVWLPAGVKFYVEDKAAPVTATFKRCLPQVCIADVDATPDMIANMKKRESGQGRIVFQSREGVEVGVPMAFKGFTAAIAAMPGSGAAPAAAPPAPAPRPAAK